MKQLAIVTKKDSHEFTVKCEDKKEYTIKIEKNYLCESLDELYQSGSLFYFNPMKNRVVFPNEDIYSYEDYEIPEERTDLIE